MVYRKSNVEFCNIVKEVDVVICNYLIDRIIEIFRGRDTEERVIKVKTKPGNFKRLISKI